MEGRAGAHFLCTVWLLDQCVSNEKKVSAHFLYLNIKNDSNGKCHAHACDTYLEIIDHFRRGKTRAAPKYNVSLRDDL